MADDTVFIAFQANDQTRSIVEAIVQDNPGAVVHHMPAMVKIDRPQRLVVRRQSIEERIGHPFDLGELQIDLITLGGNIDEDDDEFVIHWNP